MQYQLRTARNYQLLIADKTIINVLAYSRMLLDVEPDGIDAAVLDTMETFLPRHYSQPSDGFRAKVAGLRDTAAVTLRGLYDRLGVSVLDIPAGLETDQRVERIVQRVTEAGLVLAG